MTVIRATRIELYKRLSRDEVVQRVVRIPPRARLFPEPDLLFDIWHRGLPWGSKIRSEPCTCGRPPAPHRHRYLEGGELHAGLVWRVGAELRFVLEDDRIVLTGDVEG
jgi:hypothetical protein